MAFGVCRYFGRRRSFPQRRFQNIKQVRGLLIIGIYYRFKWGTFRVAGDDIILTCIRLVSFSAIIAYPYPRLILMRRSVVLLLQGDKIRHGIILFS